MENQTDTNVNVNRNKTSVLSALIRGLGCLGLLLITLIFIIPFLGGFLHGVNNPYGEIPVHVYSRPSLLDESLVVILENQSNESITIEAEFTSVDKKTTKSFIVIIGEKGKKEIGWMENWAVQYGQVLTLRKEGYSTGVFPITKENTTPVIR